MTCGWQMDSKKVILQMEILLVRTKSEVGGAQNLAKTSALQILLVEVGKEGRKVTSDVGGANFSSSFFWQLGCYLPTQ